MKEIFNSCQTDPKPPSITKVPHNTVVSTGGEATLHCRAQGSPKPKVTWYKKDKKLAWCTGGQRNRCDVEKNLKTHYVINKTTLVIKNVSYTNNHGLYSCLAQNILGQRNKTVFLTIHGMLQAQYFNSLITYMTKLLKSDQLAESGAVFCKHNENKSKIRCKNS